jgi:hypothetical protein
MFLQGVKIINITINILTIKGGKTGGLFNAQNLSLSSLQTSWWASPPNNFLFILYL